MKPLVHALLMIATPALFSFAEHARAEAREFEIDDEHFSIVFRVDHIGYAGQIGQFLEAEGRFTYDEAANALLDGEVVVTADSVFTNHRRRDNHLKGGDFLDADEYPEIRFEVTGHRVDESGGHTVDGNLTLLGQTRPVSLSATLNKAADYPFGHEEYTLGLSARTTIRRSEWGMDYGIEGGLVGDEVELWFEFEAIAD
ncbi:YceI family protein [Wenzhouxiangella marina]|uniref:Lipid/polyisoprenoid-binding, YceI-like protein n=1 Tax=Wenzhouxiangella marina TaxID=1579979 RepID=A0A0K0Y030_9GAMM|nr:YceI family protein [Wenzhouxiangella marina]AKS43294.1 Lipid/polyisoprenoid-binding, YceI-like protein [Wenzhouxiangella marina]MBB6087016.1 polyisoprenoid-binding protein YceI [Wenzhouxiangella marina]